MKMWIMAFLFEITYTGVLNIFTCVKKIIFNNSYLIVWSFFKEVNMLTVQLYRFAIFSTSKNIVT